MNKLVGFVVVAAAVAGSVWYLEQPDEGVAPVAWGEATCSHCKMHVGDRRFAAQLQTESGAVHNFDDTGCLFEWVEAHAPSIRHAYFQDHRHDRWLNYRQVGFIRVDEPTPMGYGLGAVNRAAHSDAMSFSEASRKVISGRIEADTGETGDRPGTDR